MNCQAAAQYQHRDIESNGAIRVKIPLPPEHYYQNQGMVPKTGPVECVTTSVVILMNMMKDRLAQELNQPPIPDISIREYAAKLDEMGFSGLRYRLPSDFFLAAGRGWMHPVCQAPSALRKFAKELKQRYGRSFQVKQTSGNCLEDIIQAIQDGNFVIVHGLWPVKDPKESLYKFGGGPHSMVPVGVDSQVERVLLLNPAEPDPKTIDPDNPASYPVARVYAMPAREFLDFWGRKSFLNLYTRPFTMTVVITEFNT
jgi:hypothetical protein